MPSSNPVDVVEPQEVTEPAVEGFPEQPQRVLLLMPPELRHEVRLARARVKRHLEKWSDEQLQAELHKITMRQDAVWSLIWLQHRTELEARGMHAVVLELRRVALDELSWWV